MEQAKQVQRPGQGKQEINQRKRVTNQRIPLAQEGQAAVVERIPEGDFPAPETFPEILRQRVAEQAKVAINEAARVEHDAGKNEEDEQRQSSGKARPREPTV